MVSVPFFCFLFGQNDVILHLPSLHFIFIETVSLILCRFGAYLTKKKMFSKMT